MKQHRVLYLSPVSYFKGGAENSLFDLLVNPNVEPVLVAPEEGPILEKGRTLGIECEVLDYGSINLIRRPFSMSQGLRAMGDLLSAANNLGKICEKSDCLLVHSNGLKAHAINVVSGLFSRRKSIIHIRDIPYTKIEKWVWYLLYLLCDRMVLVSAACWPFEKLGAKCRVIHNGIDLSNEAYTTTNLNAGSNPNNKADDSEIVVGFVGRIHPHKGLHILLQWLGDAVSQGIKVKLSIRGSFSSDAPEYEEQIQRQIHSMNMCQHVEFLGYVSDPGKVYDQVNLVVVPSNMPDPLPRSVMEPMAQGIPVMGYPAGGIPEMIEDGETGFLVKDSATFCTILERYSSNPESLEAIREKAKLKIATTFSTEILYAQISDLYSQLKR